MFEVEQTPSHKDEINAVEALSKTKGNMFVRSEHTTKSHMGSRVGDYVHYCFYILIVDLRGAEILQIHII